MLVPKRVPPQPIRPNDYEPGESIILTMSIKGFLAIVVLLAPSFVRAQVNDLSRLREACCHASAAQALADQLLDWNELGRYHADNEKLKAQPADSKRVVFMGDSITDAWKLPQYFPGKPYVNRGISAQGTAEMLVRMFEDVINLKPKVMIILAGTNDISRDDIGWSCVIRCAAGLELRSTQLASPGGALSSLEILAKVEENLQLMTELAQLHGIKVVLCSVTPVSDYGSVKMTARRSPSDILKLNAWLKEYAARSHAIYCDYFDALVDKKGMMKKGTSRGDGLHPNDKGYALMAPVAAAAIQEALSK
jgi:lysophospholipase L1-like esterase